MRMIFTFLAFLGLSFAPGNLTSQAAPQGELEERMDALMIEISARRDTLEIYEVNNLQDQLIELNPTHHSDLESELAKQLLKKAKLAVV